VKDPLQRTARCQCGQLTITVGGTPRLVGACHCQACQRRTGSVVGVVAFFENGQVSERTGKSSTYRRIADSGAELTYQFCPDCGTSLYWSRSTMPDVTAVAVGGFADAEFPGPSRVVWAEHRHDWLDELSELPRFPKAPT